MPVEIEAKMAVADHGPVRDALRRVGAEPLGKVLERNVFFDTKDAALLAAGEGLRIRTNHDLETGRETHVVTHKGPLQPGAFKSREESELTVADAGDCARLFDKLGFVRTLSFEKRRESWKLGPCKVELDEVPHLGTYVEVEGPGEAEVTAAREALGLADRPVIKTSYIGLLTKYLKEQGRAGGRDVRDAETRIRLTRSAFTSVRWNRRSRLLCSGGWSAFLGTGGTDILVRNYALGETAPITGADVAGFCAAQHNKL